MPEAPHEIHNRLACDLCKRLVAGTMSESEAFVVLESLVLGAMLFFRPVPTQAAEILDSMTQRVIERMKDA